MEAAAAAAAPALKQQVNAKGVSASSRHFTCLLFYSPHPFARSHLSFHVVSSCEHL